MMRASTGMTFGLSRRAGPSARSGGSTARWFSVSSSTYSPRKAPAGIAKICGPDLSRYCWLRHGSGPGRIDVDLSVDVVEPIERDGMNHLGWARRMAPKIWPVTKTAVTAFWTTREIIIFRIELQMQRDPLERWFLVSGS